MNSQFARRVFAVAPTVGLVLVMCATILAQDVKYNFAMGTNFAQFKTYRWVNIPNQNHPDQLTDQQIKAAIDADLASKGFTKVTADTADLLVAYQVAVDHEKQWTAYGGMGGLRFGGVGEATSSTINVGTLTFDVYDAKGMKQIWTGDATKTVDPSGNPEKNQEHLKKGIDKLLKNFPPPAKK